VLRTYSWADWVLALVAGIAIVNVALVGRLRLLTRRR
jgi:hypothetical protein